MKDKIELNRIYNENCLNTMSRIPNNFIDLVITSPPYNMNLRIRDGKYCSRQIVKEFSTKYDYFEDNLPINDFYKLHFSIIQELLRVSKLTFYVIQIVTGSKRAFFKLIGDFNEYIKDIIIWDKINEQPAMQSGVLNSRNEIILIFDNKNPISRKFDKFNFDRGNLSNIWRIKRNKKSNKEHRAIFSEELVNEIITNFSNKNDIIYDPMAGSGTVPKIAKLKYRNWIVSEISKEYCNIIKEKLDTTIRRNNLF